MQNTQKNFTVENLVAKYRNYVAENCPKEYYCDDYQDKNGKLHVSEGYNPISPYGDVDEQLLVALYKQVAGNDADEKVLTALSKYAEVFYHNALTEEEFSFLCSNFEETVAFSFSYMQEHKGRLESEPVPLEMIDIVKRNAIVQKNGTVFIADAGNGDVASLFSSCAVKGFTSKKELRLDEELWALTQIRLYSQGISTGIHICEDGCTEPAYLDDVDCFIWGTAYLSSYDDVAAVYKAAKPGSQMIIFMDERDAAGEKGDTYDIRRAVVDDQSIKSVISFEYKDMWLNVNWVKIALLIEKKAHDIVHIENGITKECFDIPTSLLDHELLWPSFYSTKRPDSGIPLSELVTFVDLTDRVVISDKGDWVLPDDVKQVPVAVPAKMAKEYKDANLLTQDLDVAGSKLFDEQWKFWIRALKEPCVILYGNKGKTVVGYIRELPETGFATLDTVVCLVPKEGIDIRYIAALLLTPEVKGQLESICQGFINDLSFPLVMNKVIVPNHSDKEKTEFLSEANYEALNSLRMDMEATYKEKYDAMRTDYINEVRMRKHDLRPHLRQLASTERLMLHYIEESSDMDELKNHLKRQLDQNHEAISCISAIVDHLSDEEHFGKAELVNIDKFLESIELNHNDDEGFAMEYNCDRESFRNGGFVIPVLIEKWEQEKKEGMSYKDFIHSQLNENLPLYVEIAPVDLQRLVGNIIENAKKHGLTDSNRKDYYIDIDLAFDLERKKCQIDFSNNGNPLPEGMTKERFGIRGERAGITGGSGSGGYIVKSIVNHYGGDYDIFYKHGVTTVRILLPIATI